MVAEWSCQEVLRWFDQTFAWSTAYSDNSKLQSELAKLDGSGLLTADTSSWHFDFPSHQRSFAHHQQKLNLHTSDEVAPYNVSEYHKMSPITGLIPHGTKFDSPVRLFLRHSSTVTAGLRVLRQETCSSEWKVVRGVRFIGDCAMVQLTECCNFCISKCGKSLDWINEDVQLWIHKTFPSWPKSEASVIHYLVDCNGVSDLLDPALLTDLQDKWVSPLHERQFKNALKELQEDQVEDEAYVIPLQETPWSSTGKLCQLAVAVYTPSYKEECLANMCISNQIMQKCIGPQIISLKRQRRRHSKDECHNAKYGDDKGPFEWNGKHVSCYFKPISVDLESAQSVEIISAGSGKVLKELGFAVKVGTSRDTSGSLLTNEWPEFESRGVFALFANAADIQTGEEQRMFTALTEGLPINLKLLPMATVDDFTEHLAKAQQHNLHMWHFAGHGDSNGISWCEGFMDSDEFVDRIVSLFRDTETPPPIRCIFLNACSVITCAQKLFEKCKRACEERGVIPPVVISWIGQVDNKVSVEFAAEFYEKCFNSVDQSEFKFAYIQACHKLPTMSKHVSRNRNLPCFFGDKAYTGRNPWLQEDLDNFVTSAPASSSDTCVVPSRSNNKHSGDMESQQKRPHRTLLIVTLVGMTLSFFYYWHRVAHGVMASLMILRRCAHAAISFLRNRSDTNLLRLVSNNALRRQFPTINV